VTRVVQVSLETNPDDIDAAAWLAFKKGNLSRDPRGIDINGRKGYTRVKDTGMYYPATGRLAASLWEMLTSKEGYSYHGNPYVFRVDARRLHEAWREWAESGLRYIREVCYPWYPKYLQPDGTISAALNLDGPDPAADLAGYFGTGIFLAMGVWAGRVAPGSTSYVQKYSIYPRPPASAGPSCTPSTTPTAWKNRRCLRRTAARSCRSTIRRNGRTSAWASVTTEDPSASRSPTRSPISRSSRRGRSATPSRPRIARSPTRRSQETPTPPRAKIC
jgi:hypothetical protein